eukprot:767092-Hanusia_phi.AAC.1
MSSCDAWPPPPRALVVQHVSEKLNCSAHDAEKLLQEASKRVLTHGEATASLLNQADASGLSLAPELFPLFRQQAHLRTCGLASLSIALDYLAGHQSVTITEADLEDMLDMSPGSLCVDDIRRGGMSLRQFSQVVQHVNSCGMAAVRSEIIRFADVETFRSALTHLLARSSATRQVVVCNYSMSAAGQGYWWGGHFSPVAAMDPTSDRALVLDVWQFTRPLWVDVQRLFEAMATEDKTSGERRGLVVIANSTKT